MKERVHKIDLNHSLKFIHKFLAKIQIIKLLFNSQIKKKDLRIYSKKVNFQRPQED